jgi:hypothetical protein
MDLNNNTTEQSNLESNEELAELISSSDDDTTQSLSKFMYFLVKEENLTFVKWHFTQAYFDANKCAEARLWVAFKKRRTMF